MKRAKVTGARSVREVEAYLPDNYRVTDWYQHGNRLIVLIEGEDALGWTLADYVAPRLASGLMGCAETTEGDEIDRELAESERRMASDDPVERYAEMRRMKG